MYLVKYEKICCMAQVVTRFFVSHDGKDTNMTGELQLEHEEHEDMVILGPGYLGPDKEVRFIFTLGRPPAKGQHIQQSVQPPPAGPAQLRTYQSAVQVYPYRLLVLVAYGHRAYMWDFAAFTLNTGVSRITVHSFCSLRARHREHIPKASMHASLNLNVYRCWTAFLG